MIIVKSKITGKFLRQHSGSARNLHMKTYYQVIKDKTLDLPEDDRKGNMYSFDTVSDRAKAIRKEIHKRIYNSDALGARRYASERSVLPSIGEWGGNDKAPECRSKAERKKAHYVLPDCLELHEIVAGNLCLANPDDTDKVKNKKKDGCK